MHRDSASCATSVLTLQWSKITQSIKYIGERLEHFHYDELYHFFYKTTKYARWRTYALLGGKALINSMLVIITHRSCIEPAV